MNTDKLDYLPDTKRRELERVVKILFDEFEDATKTALSHKRKAGRILKVILFGSYARGDWVEDRLSGIALTMTFWSSSMARTSPTCIPIGTRLISTSSRN